MDIKSIITSIVEKKLKKGDDDPCWDGYVQLGMKKKGGKEVPNCVPKESVELKEKATDYESYDDYVSSRKKKGLQVLPRKLWDNLKKDSMKESVELDEAKTDAYHQHMLKALGKSRLPKNHSFTSAIADNGDFIVRDGGGRVVGRIPKGEHDLKESTELYEVLAKDYSGMLGKFKKAVERAEQAKNKGDTKKMEMHLDTARGYLFGMKSTDTAKLKNSDHYDKYKEMKGLKESIEELTEDVHNDLNDAIIEFQRKLMRMTRQLDPAIAKEVKKIDKDLDDLRTGPLFKIRPGR